LCDCDKEFVVFIVLRFCISNVSTYKY
jgi:hypothetical protein